MNEGIERLLTSRPEIPCADAVPGVRQLRARLEELRARRDAIAREIAAVVSRPAPSAPALSAAQRLLDGDVEQAVAGPGIDQQVSELRKTQRIVADAIKLGELELRRLIRQAAPQLLAGLKQWHRGVVAEAARRLVEVQVLRGAELAVLRELESADLPAGGIGELQQLSDTSWYIERLLADGLLNGSESWLPDSHRPTPPTVAAVATGAIGRMARAVAGAVSGKSGQAEASFGGAEKWQ